MSILGLKTDTDQITILWSRIFFFIQILLQEHTSSVEVLGAYFWTHMPGCSCNYEAND